MCRELTPHPVQEAMGLTSGHSLGLGSSTVTTSPVSVHRVGLLLNAKSVCSCMHVAPATQEAEKAAHRFKASLGSSGRPDFKTRSGSGRSSEAEHLLPMHEGLGSIPGAAI